MYIIPLRETNDDIQYEIYIRSFNYVAKIINGCSDSKPGVLKLLQTIYEAAKLSSKK